jgi:hypothetical protein
MWIATFGKLHALRNLAPLSDPHSGSVKRSAGAWCFGNDEERAYWGGSMEERARSSGNQASSSSTNCLHPVAITSKSSGPAKPSSTTFFAKERARSSGFAKNVVEEGFAGPEDLEVIATGWRQFVDVSVISFECRIS